jgi:GNAT superfamily N-acetyltransferase
MDSAAADAPARDAPLTFRSGYFPGVIGQVALLHACYYHSAWGFDRSFEIQVAGEMAAFVARFNALRDGLWCALEPDGRLAGSIALCAPQPEERRAARLRWFLVAPARQGLGLGRRLLERAVAFCRLQRYSPVVLFTFEGLDAARHLYEAAGFRLAETHAVAQWGRRIVEQRFDLRPERRPSADVAGIPGPSR